MTQETTTPATLTIGIDLGDRRSHYCVLDHAGAVQEEGRLRTDREALQQRFGNTSPARVAIEAGTHSPWVSSLLEEAGHDVLVANPRKLRLIHSGDNKHDRLDAEQLARVARMDPRLLSPIEHRARQSRADLVLLRARDLLVRSRTQMVCHVRGALKSLGTRLPKCSTRTLPSRGLPGIPEDLRPALLPVLQMVRLLTRVILLYDKRIEEVASARYPETTTRRQVNGVGSLTSLAFVLTIEDPTRFRSSRRVGAHLGLRRE